MARQAGFANLSVDLMLATPGQTPQQAAALAEYGAGLGPEHISAYLLKVEPGTPFARDGMAERCPGEDETAELYLAACRTLRERGYRHYEISNFARPGYESRHNLGYWQGRDYLGLGPSAASCQVAASNLVESATWSRHMDSRSTRSTSASRGKMTPARSRRNMSR